MSTKPPPRSDAFTVTAAAAAVRYLATHGYENSTASDLADAIGMSRSTFFRRFGSKEDVVFADHDLALERLETLLADTDLAPTEAITRGTVEVLHLLIRDADAAKQRSELLRHTPSLRERELVITHRYERVFASYLARAAEPGTPDWAPIALAAGLVAVHNAALRQWLRDAHADARTFGALERDLSDLTARFAPWFGGERHPSKVLVAAFNADASPEEVLREVRAQLL
ncbi:MAG: TetR family transcriptional regulator [Leucobacter sp.]|nr:TetR family transcriptional regulator [Leucobacter sp.]